MSNRRTTSFIQDKLAIWRRGAVAHSHTKFTTTSTPIRTFEIFTSSAGALRLSAAGSAFGYYLGEFLPSRANTIRRKPPGPHNFSTSSTRLRSKMPPKKKEEEKKVPLGRPGNSLKSGIVCRIQSAPKYNLCVLLTVYLRLVWRTLVNRRCSKL